MPAAVLRGIALGLALLVAGAAARAGETNGSLYQATVFVTGQGEETRGPALARALATVLVRVSGNPALAESPAVAALGAEAGSAVAGFAYRDRMAGIPVHDEQGSRDRPYDLIVDFAPAAIDAMLAGLGETPWAGPRPELLALVTVENGATRFPLTADGARGRDMREALAAAATLYGVPVELPSAAAASPNGAGLALDGTLRWDDAALGWMADWTIAAGGTTYRWTAEAVSFDQAFRVAVGGAAQVLSGHGAPH